MQGRHGAPGDVDRAHEGERVLHLRERPDHHHQRSASVRHTELGERGRGGRLHAARQVDAAVDDVHAIGINAGVEQRRDRGAAHGDEAVGAAVLDTRRRTAPEGRRDAPREDDACVRAQRCQRAQRHAVTALWMQNVDALARDDPSQAEDRPWTPFGNERVDRDDLETGSARPLGEHCMRTQCEERASAAALEAFGHPEDLTLSAAPHGIEIDVHHRERAAVGPERCLCGSGLRHGCDGPAVMQRGFGRCTWHYTEASTAIPVLKRAISLRCESWSRVIHRATHVLRVIDLWRADVLARLRLARDMLDASRRDRARGR